MPFMACRASFLLVMKMMGKVDLNDEMAEEHCILSFNEAALMEDVVSNIILCVKLGPGCGFHRACRLSLSH